jgi:CRP/FNR family cyclic AMP-dependent transcriptional regulator
MALENPKNQAYTEPQKVQTMKPKKQLRFDPKSFLSKVGEGRTIADYHKNQIIFSQGDPADAVFYVQTGKVKLTVVSKQGKEAVIGLLGPGDFFGEACLAGQLLRMATAVALSECLIVRLEKRAATRVIHDEPEFSELFLAYVLSRNARIEEDLVDQLFNSSEKRLARVLLLLANFGKDSKPEKLVPKMSHETLAEIVGTTRPRVSVFMNKFRKLGFIDYNGGLEVHSSLLNVVLHD